MNLFDVYPLFNIEPVKAMGSWIWDKKGNKYLDLYGGHGVISIGHSHPHYVQKLQHQLGKMGFYSNSVKISLQEELADKLGELSGYPDYQLFLCNSGAEANENALKLASFVTGRKKIIAFTKSFHGRTSLAVEATNDPSIQASVNQNGNVIFLPFNDKQAFEECISGDIAAVIIEGIQGVGGVNEPDPDFLQLISSLCKKHGTKFIVDEIQSGYGRTGKFFAHQYSNVKPDLVTVAKGMGNGFPIAGVLIHPDIKPKHGMLGTTFGGNHLACAAGIAVLDVIGSQKLMENAEKVGVGVRSKLQGMAGVLEVRGRGLMIGIEVEPEFASLRKDLLEKHKIFTGASGKTVVRILPPLNISKEEMKYFIQSIVTLSAVEGQLST